MPCASSSFLYGGKLFRMSDSCDSFHAVQRQHIRDYDKCSRDVSRVVFGGRFDRSRCIWMASGPNESTCATPNDELRSKRKDKAHIDNISRLHVSLRESCNCTGQDIRPHNVYTWWADRLCEAFEREFSNPFFVRKSLDKVRIETPASHPPSGSSCEPLRNLIVWSGLDKFHIDKVSLRCEFEDVFSTWMCLVKRTCNAGIGTAERKKNIEDHELWHFDDKAYRSFARMTTNVPL